MRIIDIKGKHIKINKTSITVKTQIQERRLAL